MREKGKWRGIKKLGRVLEGHILLLYQYMSIYNKFSFDTCFKLLKTVF